MEQETTENRRGVASPDIFSLNEGELREVPITEIQSYEHNPRQCPNEEYDRIKASIRVQGLDQPLIITRRPTAKHFILLVGGNTRHRALQALYEETGDQRFLNVPCLIKPWVSESAVLLSHLRENELRDSLSFIDKARAVFEAKAMLEEEAPGQALSQRALSRLLTQRGLSYSQTLICWMDYTVNRLLPLIPQALAAGIGRPQIARILHLEKAAAGLWLQWELGSDTDFSDTFAALCKRYDSPDWDIEPLQHALEGEIADAAEQSLHKVRLEIDARLQGRRLPAVMYEPFTPDTDQPEHTINEPSASEQRPANVSEFPGKPKRHEETATHASAEEGCAESAKTSTKTHATEDVIQEGRATCHKLAHALAGRYGLTDTVMALDTGTGFLIVDIPDKELSETLDEAQRILVFGIWWTLLTLCDLLDAPPSVIKTHLHAGSLLHKALTHQEPALLYQNVQPLAPGLIGLRLWRQLTEQDLQTLYELINGYHALHRQGMASGISLWSSQEV